MIGKKIVLINPPWVFAHSRDIVLSQNLGLGYLAAYIQAQGHQVSIIDSLAEGVTFQSRVSGRYQQYLQVGLPYADIAQRIRSDADFVGITAPFTNHSRIVKELAQEIKAVLPRVPIILGGVYPSLAPADAFCPAIDYYVIGEGELALVRLLDGAAADTVPGVLRSGQTQRVNECAPTIEALDEIPFPAREKLPMPLYLARHSPRKRHLRTASVITSRGCPFGCSFCSIHRVTGRRWRRRSPENVLAEISLLRTTYGIEHIEFEDDNLTLDKERALAILAGIEKMNRDRSAISWSTPNAVRIDSLDEEMLRQMKRSNCLSLSFAVESGDPEILASMHKDLDLGKVVETAALCTRAGIATSAFFMLGYPGETTRSFMKTLAFVQELRKAGVREFFATVTRAYPGTALFAECLTKGYLADIPDRENLFLSNAVNRETSIATPDFSGREILRRMQLFERATVPWYLRWYHAHYHAIKKIIPDSAVQAIKQLLFTSNRPVRKPPNAQRTA